MNLPQIFNHSEFGSIRMCEIDGKPYAVGIDIARNLEYSNPSKAVIDHCKGVSKLGIPSAGGTQETNVIPEGDIYRLIMKAADQSKNPHIKAKAEKFESWIFDEVIPSIRKHGAYMTPETIEKAILNPDFLIQIGNQLKLEQTARFEAEAKIAEQQRKLKEQETPVAIYQLAISAHNTMSMQEVAKSLGTGRTRLYQILRLEGIIMKDSTLPYQRFLDAGLFKVAERPRASGDSIINDPATRVTAKGFDYIARLLKKRSERESERLGREA